MGGSASVEPFIVLRSDVRSAASSSSSSTQNGDGETHNVVVVSRSQPRTSIEPRDAALRIADRGGVTTIDDPHAFAEMLRRAGRLVATLSPATIALCTRDHTGDVRHDKN